ncbi:MAG: hypothetical protein U1F24_04100 [Alphaproteobacteria bacterium]
MVRDLLCNQIPLLFSSELYASVSIVTGTLCGRPRPRLRAGRGGGRRRGGRPLRLLAVRFAWGIPRFVYTKDWN